MTKVWALIIDYDGNRKPQQMMTTLYSTKEKAERALEKENLLHYQAAWIKDKEVK